MRMSVCIITAGMGQLRDLAHTHTCGRDWGTANEPKVWDHELTPKRKTLHMITGCRVRRVFQDHSTVEWVVFGLEGSFEDCDH